MPRTVYDDADVASVRDDDRMTDIRGLLRCSPALLRGIEKSIEAIARLLLAVLVHNLLIGIVCR